MISPSDRQIPYLTTVRLCALLLYVDRQGATIPDPEGFIGEIVVGTAAIISEGSAWVMTSGPRNAEVFQIFMRYNGHDIFRDPTRIRNPNHVDLEDVHLVVTGFAAQALGLKRANEHAQQRVMMNIQLWLRLIDMSDDVLMFAIGTNLYHDITVFEHERNCDLLIQFTDSSHELAEEIRAFLHGIRNPRNIQHRRNIYRMVLIVRAIQRRALELAGKKRDTLAAILFQRREVEEWIGIVVQRASRMASELGDNQPWWLGMGDSLPRGVAQQRINKFVPHLTGYIQELECVYAKPFQPWAARAANAMLAMVTGFAEKQYGKISENARKAVAALLAMRLREQISIAILLTRSENVNDRPRIINALMAARAWVRDYAPILGIAEQAAPILVPLSAESDGEWESLENALRKIEQIIDNIS